MVSHHPASLVAIDSVVVEICFQLLKGKIPHARASIHHYCLSLSKARGFLYEDRW